ncbi:MAG: hypothetical protein SH848_11205 [Saprospiraceae bacterium]|nr:hypothetical protein [Saprospiraceae bacterium]MDZ4704489.1 hypothetical protein [Saprospiraceae bacterium]
MLLRAKVLEAIQSLPDEFSIDDVVERLIILHKIETGLQQVSEGQTISTPEAREKL